MYQTRVLVHVPKLLTSPSCIPEIETAVVYKDLRAPGQLERFYLGVQEMPNSLFTRGEVAGVAKGSGHPCDRPVEFIK